jgi:hypothetical protein
MSFIKKLGALQLKDIQVTLRDGKKLFSISSTWRLPNPKCEVDVVITKSSLPSSLLNSG